MSSSLKDYFVEIPSRSLIGGLLSPKVHIGLIYRMFQANTASRESESILLQRII